MHLFDILAVLLSLAAVFSWINHRFIRLPTTIGLMLIALLLSLGLLIAPLDSEWQAALKQLLEEVDFEDTLMHRMHDFAPGTVTLLTWAGLRGGISIALALSLPDGETRDILVSVTYVVVVFSILVQGLTLGPLVRVIGQHVDRELLDVAAGSESSASTAN